MQRRPQPDAFSNVSPEVTSDDGVSHDDVKLFQSGQRPVQRGSFSCVVPPVLQGAGPISQIIQLWFLKKTQNSLLMSEDGYLESGGPLGLYWRLGLREISHEPEDDPPHCQRGLGRTTGAPWSINTHNPPAGAAQKTNDGG